MGELTRHFNWSQSPLGPPDRWPPSLRVTVSNLLRSRFPTLLMWGNELFQFYNDAFRPSLGADGKHPTALGQRGADCWKEAWPLVGPLLERVRATGEAVWMENQLVPICRNGKMEEVYWTYSYSPILNEAGGYGGILVTCTETTQTVLTLQRLAESEDQLRFAIESTDLGTWEYNPVINRFTGNRRVKEWFGLPLEQDIDLALALAAVAETDRPTVVAAIKNALNPASGGYYDCEYTVVHPLTKQERHVRAKGRAWFTEEKIPCRFNGTLQDVTQEVIAKRQLLEREKSLEMAVEIGELGIFNVDWTTGSATFSQQVMEWFGLAAQENSLSKVYKKIFPADQAFVEETIERSVAGEWDGRHDITYRIPQPDGSVRYLRSIGQVMFEDGKATTISGILQDVTPQVLARQKLEESEAQLRSIIQSAPAAMGLFVGRDLVVQVPNQAFIDIVGKGPDIEGKPLRDVMPELLTENQPFLRILNDVFASGTMFQSFGSQVRIVQNGVMTDNYYNITYTPLRNKQGEVYAILDIAIDVTEAVKARKALETTEANLRNTILKAPVAMCIFRGADHVVEIANERMLAFWGKTAEQVINRPIFEGLPEARDQGFERLLDGVRTTGESFSAVEVPVSLPRGEGLETVYANFVYEAIREADNTVFGIMAVAVEVTEQVQARRQIEAVVAQRTKSLAEVNDALQAANRELQRSNQSLEEFAHAASHDLKEPIRKIHFFTGRLKEQLKEQLDQDQSLTFSRIENASERMAMLVDDLLLYSHVSQRPHEKEAIDLNLKLRRVMEDLDLDIQEKGATVNVTELPVVQGYRRQLQQLFQNLISNALKYSKADEPPVIDVSASTAERDGRRYHLITVRDNGIGFEQEYAGKIFQMFTRLHGKQEYSGTGVGLSIAKKVVENHEGFIEAEGTPGTGACFKIYLPVT